MEALFSEHSQKYWMEVFARPTHEKLSLLKQHIGLTAAYFRSNPKINTLFQPRPYRGACSVCESLSKGHKPRHTISLRSILLKIMLFDLRLRI